MTDLILILSKFKTSKAKKMRGFNLFHFKGYYQGKKVEYIVSSKSSEFEFVENEDYLLWAKRKSIQSGILEIDIIKSKKIT